MTAEPAPPTGEFCVRCGAVGRPLTEGICADCFAATHPIVQPPVHARVVLCPTCGARQIGSHWERAGSVAQLTAEDLAPLLRPHPEAGIRRIAWEETGRNPHVREMRGVIDVDFRGTERSVAVEFPVQLEHRTCPECSRRSGHYYTALLQLRGPEGRRPSGHREALERLHRLWDQEMPEIRASWRAALSWEERRPEGFDFYLTDTVSARALARHLKRRLGATLTESPSLYGRKDGRDLYRVTFCLRVPPEPAPGELPGTTPRRRGRSAPAPAPTRRPLER